MSTKKDKFSSKEKNYMRLALNLARARKGLTGDNPSVGCVIVKKNQIISIGQTGYNGRPHAETNAINNAFQSISGSEMYVSLEPCNHYGKTSPCTNRIIKSGINKVYYCIDDIDQKVKGKSFKILKDKNIHVKRGILEKNAIDLYNSYKVNRKNKLPYVIGKIAISKNKLIYSKGTKRITDKYSDKLTHYLRYKNDAIMISSKTLNIDNPKLNCRLKGLENFSPRRIILDKLLTIKLNSYIIKSSKKENTIIFHNSTNFLKIKSLKKRGLYLIKLSFDKKGHFDLKKILKRLFKLGIRNLLVEGGDNLTKKFLEKRLFNEFYLFRSPKILSKSNKHQFFTSQGILNTTYNRKFKFSSKLAKDNITIYKR